MRQRNRLFLLAACLTAGSFFTFGEGTGWAIDICGNGICHGTSLPRETCTTCPEDCGPCPGTDQDYDGVSDNYDNCPTMSNSNQADCDHDGIGDACDSLNATQSSVSTSSITGTQWYGSQCHLSYFSGSEYYDTYRITYQTCYGTKTTYCNGQTVTNWNGGCQSSQAWCSRQTYIGCTGGYSYPWYPSCPF